MSAEARRLTNGRGVDVVVNNTDPAPILKDIDAPRQVKGHIALLGFLEGLTADWDPNALLNLVGKRASVR